MIIVDGCRSEQHISNFANLEEVLANVMDDEKMDGRIVTDVFVNNESFSEIYPHQAEDMSCDSITSVEVRAQAADAQELLQDELDVTRDFMGMVTHLRDRYLGGVDEEFLARTEKLSSLISEMSEVMESEDWVLLADLLEFEFAPLCEEWRVAGETIHRQLAGLRQQ